MMCSQSRSTWNTRTLINVYKWVLFLTNNLLGKSLMGKKRRLSKGVVITHSQLTVQTSHGLETLICCAVSVIMDWRNWGWNVVAHHTSIGHKPDVFAYLTLSKVSPSKVYNCIYLSTAFFPPCANFDGPRTSREPCPSATFCTFSSLQEEIKEKNSTV